MGLAFGVGRGSLGAPTLRLLPGSRHGDAIRSPCTVGAQETLKPPWRVVLWWPPRADREEPRWPETPRTWSSLAVELR
ncbi:hypothetical protein NDU88_001402 [Pleurodeles waltl]|uniref:Uncharacterized protein n=1 Tax=Pleurodeles waltl TaxID=8319 RepID=A0AAV7WLE3_PLEWA|nr:hypothetical protein NDU88_001402 [Pleurodeles waltl]